MYFTTLPSAAAILQDTEATQSAPTDATPGGDQGQGQGTPPSPCGGNMMVPMLLILGIFWIVMIGPERKKRKAREAMLGSMQKGDKVMTSGGMFGSIAQVQDDVVTVQVADNVRIKFTRAAIQAVLEKKDGTQVEAAPEKKG